MASMLLAGGNFPPSNFCGDTCSNNRRDVFGASTSSAFLFATMNERLQPCTTMPVKHTHSFRTVKSVWGNGQQIHSQVFHIQWHPPGAGDCIDEQGNSALAR